MDDETGGGGRNLGKEECKGRLILLIMKYRKSSIKSPVRLIYLKYVKLGRGGGGWGLIETEGQEPVGGQMVSVIDP